MALEIWFWTSIVFVCIEVLVFIKKFSTVSALTKSVDSNKGFSFTNKFGLVGISVSSSENREITLFQVFLNGFIVVVAIFSGKDWISSHVKGIWVYFHIIKTQKNIVINVITKNHHCVKYENGENVVRLFNCQLSKNNKVHIEKLNNINSRIKYRENPEIIIKAIASIINKHHNTYNTYKNLIL